MKWSQVTPITSARADTKKRPALSDRSGDSTEVPASPSPSEVPPSAPPEAPSGTPTELPQPDAPPQPNSAPQPQAMTIYVRFLQRRKTRMVTLPKRATDHLDRSSN